jgi:predicted enzyme related to lactoylglutathione lyase
MRMAGGSPGGQFSWYGLRTTDPEGAAAFYVSVVGWSALNLGPRTNNYRLFCTPEGAIAGITQVASREGPARWSGYVAVDDVDAYAARITAAGGKVLHTPVNVPGVLRYTEAADPEGARFIVYKPFGGDPPRRGGPEDPGYVGWHELLAADGATAFDFYAAVFGWRRTGEHDMGPLGAYRLWSDGRGVDVGGVMTAPSEGARPCWSYYLQVGSVDAAIDRIRAGGGSVEGNGPRQTPTGDWIVHASDPQGAAFALLSRRW